MIRSRSMLLALGAATTLVWTPVVIAQVLVVPAPDPVVPASVIVVEPGAARVESGHIQSRVAMVEPAALATERPPQTPVVATLKLEDGTRLIVPNPTALGAEVGERVNVSFVADGGGQRIATMLTIDSEAEAP